VILIEVPQTVVDKHRSAESAVQLERDQALTRARIGPIRPAGGGTVPIGAVRLELVAELARFRRPAVRVVVGELFDRVRVVQNHASEHHERASDGEKER